MTDREFVQRARCIAECTKTAYMWGTFGGLITEALIAQKAKQYPARYSEARQKALRELIPQGVWAFDCIGLVKGILWGWDNNPVKTFGGAVYQSDGVPDVTVSGMKGLSYDLSADMNNVLPGEVVYKKGHIGICLGDGKVAQATLNSEHDGVVITDLSADAWVEHAKLPYVEYEISPAKPVVGDVVYFTGGKHYLSSNGSIGFNARPGDARVTRYLPGRKHPYHLIHTDKTSNVYGWVNADTVKAL